MFKSECFVLRQNWCSGRYFIIKFLCVAEKYMEFDLNDKGDIGTLAQILTTKLFLDGTTVQTFHLQ